MEKLTHWKQTRNAEYLGSYDLCISADENGKPIYKEIVVTIDKVVDNEEVVDVSGKSNEKQICTVAYFKNGIKKMILNSTNKEAIEKITGSPFLEFWSNKQVCIYVQKGVYKPGTKKSDNITTDALRIKFVPKRLCDVCGKVISEATWAGSMAKYGHALCSKECLEKIQNKE